jgi:type I restriction enzyme M protein
MERSKKGAAIQPQTTAQSLGSLLKSVRDIMRKDKGLNGDLDRLPLLTWIMFLKFLDDLELQREEGAKLAGKKFRLAIEPPYRWRDWAARADGITGDELLAFINQEECTRPDGKKGAGLFAYLRKLTSSNGDDRRDVIATVFRGVDNRMKSGYLLRDVINKAHSIHFNASDELHTLGALYESMLREMRDAAGDSGEFYTPRPVVRFMVEAVNPRLGETVLDPACGTGGFLVEAFNHLSKQVKTVADRRMLQAESLFGCEPKPLPYLLGQMNLLLHGLDAPQIDPGNALRFKLTEIGEKDRVDVILTNPPFGGEEEKGIQGNFPDDRQTGETALLFLQLIMRKLRRTPGRGTRPTAVGPVPSPGVFARAAVVVPNGTLFGDGVCARIKEELLKEFNLHTIVRLPNGVFAPYTSIPTNLLFFDRSGPTREVWYYEHPLPEGRKNYTKTAPIQFEEFAGCLKWWNKRKENDRAWKVSVEELLANNCNLDRKNPRSKDDMTHLPPEQIADDILKKEQRIAAIIAEIKTALAEKP